MQEIQERRSKVVVPGARPLHEYVNLYINARNIMLNKVIRTHGDLKICVLRISPDVLNLKNVVIADRNAASDYARFHASPNGLVFIDKERVFAKYWNHDDYIEKIRHASIMCAEVLIPHRVDQTFIMGAYISCTQSQDTLLDIVSDMPVELNNYLFFK